MTLDEHQLDEDGEHDPDECEVCYECDHSIKSTCDCGRCCESLLIEVSLRDAEREPRIKTEASPTFCDLRTGTKELIGYLLNGKHGHCVFFDPNTRKCGIYETRPLVCRVFDCDKDMAQIDQEFINITNANRDP
jgi:uncharacterized protein